MTKGIEEMIGTRKKLGMTQEQLADALGVITRSTIASIESGHIRPSVRSAKIIGGYLKFDWTLFFDEE